MKPRPTAEGGPPPPEIEAARQQCESVLDALPHLVFVHDGDGHLLHANRRYAERAGVPVSAVVGKAYWEVFPRLEAAPAPAAAACSRELELETGERFKWSTTPVPDRHGEVAWFVNLLEEVSDQHVLEQARQRSERFLNEAQRIARIGNWELDLVDDELTWSAEIYRIFEIDPNAFGASYEAFLDLVHPHDRERVNQAYTESVRSKIPYDIVHRLLLPDGRIKFVHERCETTYDAAGQPMRSAGTVQDITELNVAEMKIRRLNQELEQRVRDRTAELQAAIEDAEAFAYSVSHDLRAPLRVIDSFSRALLEDHAGQLDAEGRDYLERTCAASQRMAQLIDDLLRLSHIGRAPLAHEPVDLSILARAVAAELGLAQPERDIELVIHDGIRARGDPRLLRVVLENLLDNAWKFTGGHPRARIEFGVRVDHGRRAFFVRDNGAGFDMAHADRLCIPFQRLHTADQFPGIGIGMSLVERIVRRHGGTVWAEAAIGQGTTIYFALE
jgi:signal transduction histidine kinase